MVRLIPRDTKFFKLFTEMSANLSEGARLLQKTLGDFKGVEDRVRQLKVIEHRGDEMTHGILTGSTNRLSAVRWGVAGRIVWAWVLTIPASATVAALTFWLIHRF